jgi:tetratricopeptide (TPR) repeat protein
MRALRAYAARDSSGMESVARDLESARAITVAIAFSDVALYAGNLEGADSLARRFIEVVRSPELRALCHIQLAHLALARGRPDVAREEMERAERLDQVWGLEVRALLATLPFAPADEPELRALRAKLSAWDAAATPPSSFLIFAMHNDLHPAIRGYLLGLIAVRLGDIEETRAHAADLARIAPGDGGLADCLSAELAAHVARGEGKVGEALGHLERSRPRLWFQLTVASPFFSLASRRFLQAELLYEAGRVEEAAGWYDSIAQRSPYELVYAAPARERLSDIARAKVSS